MSSNAIKTITLFAFLTISLWGCPQPHAARRQLEADGFTEIHINSEGWRGYRCGGGWHSTGFVAKSPIGRRVEGAVCCGVLTACTVKLSHVEVAGG